MLRLILAAEFPSTCLIFLLLHRLLSIRSLTARTLCCSYCSHLFFFLLLKGCFTQKIYFLLVWDIADFFFFFLNRLHHVIFFFPSQHILSEILVQTSLKCTLQEVQSDECKLLFPVLVWRLRKIWVAGRRYCQIVFVFYFVFLHKSWFRWKALVSEHHLTMLILMHMLFFLFPSPVLTALFLFWWEHSKGKKTWLIRIIIFWKFVPFVFKC